MEPITWSTTEGESENKDELVAAFCFGEAVRKLVLKWNVGIVLNGGIIYLDGGYYHFSFVKHPKTVRSTEM